MSGWMMWMGHRIGIRRESRTTRVYDAKRRCNMIENVILALFIAIPVVLLAAAAVATIRTNRMSDFEEEV